MPSAPPSSNQVVSKKKRKNRADKSSTAVASEVTSEQSTPASAPISQPSTSTIDTNGMPKKKRKRGEDAASSQLQGMSSEDVPGRAKDGTRAEEHTSSEHSKKQSRKDKKAGAALASDLPPSASTSREPPSIPVGSKRKRQDTPEVTTSHQAALSINAALAVRPPSPSSPIRKKRKKEKRVQVVEEPVVLATEAAEKPKKDKKDKKGKRKANEATLPVGQPAAAEAHASEPREGDAADTEENGTLANTPRKEKKKKKKRVTSHEASDREIEPSQPPAGTPKKKKREHKEASEIDETSAPPDPTSAADEPSAAANALKKKRKKRNASELTTEVEESPMVTPAEESAIAAPSVPAEAQPAPAKRKRDRKSSANETVADSSMVTEPTSEVVPAASEAHPIPISAPVLGEAKAKEGKKKRRKTLATDTGVDPDASSASISPTEVGLTEAPSASAPLVETTPSKKRSKRKSVAPSASSQRPSDPEGTFAIVQAAVQAILARAPPSTTPPEIQESSPSIPEPEPEPVLPGRKRTAGRSKLRQAWGPEDIIDDDQSSASISRVIVPDLDSAASQPVPASAPSTSGQPSSSSASPSSGSAQQAKQPSKAVNGKKGRPSSVPSCPICDKASAHARSECPVVQGGPESLRTRIAQLKNTGRNADLVDELEILLEEAQRRRKSLGDQRVGGVPSPINVPSGSGHTSDEATPSPIFPLSAAKFTSPTSSRPTLPRVPAGSEISEVAVESKDEGSSNESESEDDSEEGADNRDNVALTSPTLPDVSGTDLASVDLEALLRGPAKPRGSILNQIPSESTTEDEESSDDDARPEEDVDLSEEDKNDRAYRRLSRKLERAASSSEDEPEPEPEVEPGTADVDSAETFVPPTIMDADPNDTAGQDIEEADVPMADPDVILDTTVASPSEEQTVQNDASVGVTKSPTEERSDQGYESDAGEATTPASSSTSGREKQAGPGDESIEVERATEPQSVPNASSADRGDDSRVEHTADVDGPVASQESPASLERSRNELSSSQSDAAPGEQSDADDVDIAEEEGAEGVPVAEGHDESDSEDAEDATANKSAEEQQEVDNALSEKGDEEVEEESPVQNVSAREHSPELGSPESVPEEAAPEPTPPAPPLRQLGPIAEDVEMHASSSSRPASSLDLHHDHDPSDPIESLGSFADVSERRNAIDDDPIEDADMDHQSAKGSSAQDPLNQSASGLDELQEKGTPPPAVPRTPGTVSRMKDRYGRLSRKEKLSSLSEQLLGSIPSSSQPEPDVEGDLQEQNAEDESQPAAELDAEKPQDSTASSQQIQQEEEQNGRPRRTTRVTTRRASAMPRGTTEPPAPAPTAAPVPTPPATEPAAAPVPKRRGGRLTAEEKAAREAEKKAERERKAAEKKAEKEAKEAEKRAAKEAKEAAKRAEKEAKEAAKRAAQQEKEKEKEGGDDVPKKGRTKATRGRATTVKPVSTRSRAVAKADVEEVDETDAPADPPATSTPGFSKVSWTTLPQPQTQSEIAEAESSMVDELQPSSPGQTTPAASRSPEPISNLTPTNTEKDEADVSREVTITQDRSEPNEDEDAEVDLLAATPKPPIRQKEPLFIPSSSQFPNTPFPGEGLQEASRGNDSDSDGGEDAQDADEGDVFKVPRTRPKANWEPPYRRLSDIASQQLFSPAHIPSPALFAASQSQPRKSGFDHQAEDDDDDDDDSDGGTSSDSDAERKKSHIPQERRAGAGVQKKKKAGLLASLG